MNSPVVPASAWLLAQASIAASHKTLRQLTSTLCIPSHDVHSHAAIKDQNKHELTIGPGRDGGLSWSTGFLTTFEPEPSLPSAFKSWETIMSQLPQLLRQGRVHEVVQDLPSLLSELMLLDERYLSRAAIVISSILQSLAYEIRNLGNDLFMIPLPHKLMEPWDYICTKLGRPQTARMIADDMLNNVLRCPGQPIRALTQYFDVQEEHMSVGLQIQMEEAFAPALEMMTNTQRSILAGDNTAIIRELGKISQCLILCGEVFLSVPFYHGKDSFDPIYWGKTYPEIGRPVRIGMLANSGVNSPLFHALDAFLGTIHPQDDLHSQQITRRSILPSPVRHFIQALEDPHYSICSYIEKSNSPSVKVAFDAVIQIYAWLLERHRLRAISTISIALASGRPQTAGGANQQHHSAIPVDEMLNNQMQTAIDMRLRGHFQTLSSKVVSVLLTGKKTTSLTLLLPCPMPVEPGDRIQVWPRHQVGSAEISQIKRILNNDKDIEIPISLDSRDLRKLFDEIQPGISLEELIKKLPILPPRHYTVAKVEKDIDGLSQYLTLSIAHSEGISATFLRQSIPGQLLTTRLIPEPLFRPPSDRSLPLLLVAQGAGVGPFIGFLGQRILQRMYDDAHIVVVLSARKLADVPYLKELTDFTAQLPLTVHLALSAEPGHTIKSAVDKQWSNTIKVQSLLASLKYEPEGHVFVCGSIRFGYSIRSCLYDMQVIDKRRYHENCFGGHEIPALQREVTLEELSTHNKPNNLWLAINGIVYNLTNFSESHPGGLKTLIESAGTIADRRFYLIHSGNGSQGILAQVAQYAIGPLTNGSLSPLQATALAQIVMAENILSNNSSCAAERHIPFFIYADSLSVTCKDLEKIMQYFDREVVPVKLLTKLDSHFIDLKAAGVFDIFNSLERVS
uniref:Indoleamine 2,3-dioxygenase n=1 Tax=Talaromyces marneffei PM1 TaxID=1077442 RepID=A0A093UUN5_TALMA